MTFIPYVRGATAHEGQIGLLCYRLPFWRFIRAGCRPRMYIDTKEGST